MSELAAAPRKLHQSQAWLRQPERGHPKLVRAMRTFSLRLGRPLSRVVLALVVGYFWLWPGAAGEAIRSYQRRVLGRTPTRRDLYVHLHAFATCLQDRIFLLNDRLAEFAVEVDNEPLLLRKLEQGAGCFLMGAHLGSFEVLRAFGVQHPGVEVAMAMYEENARNIGAVLAAINPRRVADIIPLGSIDAMLKVRARLDRGAFVGVLGDRTLGDEPVLNLDFLGSPAPFPIGPWRAAALLRTPVLFIAGLYCGANRYRIMVEPLADFTATEAVGRETAVREAMVRYVAVLEKLCRSHPYNWFNLFDFWHELPPAKTG